MCYSLLFTVKLKLFGLWLEKMLGLSNSEAMSCPVFSLARGGQGEHFSWLTCCLKLSLQLVHLLDETTDLCRIMQWSIWMWIHIGIIWAWSCQEWSKVARPWSSLHRNFGPSSHYESCLGPSMCLVTEKFLCLEMPREVLKHLVLWATHAVGARLVWVWKVESLVVKQTSSRYWSEGMLGDGEPEDFSGWTSIYRIYRLFMAVLWCLHIWYMFFNMFSRVPGWPIAICWPIAIWPRQGYDFSTCCKLAASNQHDAGIP